jgi:hypothetical protein
MKQSKLSPQICSYRHTPNLIPRLRPNDGHHANATPLIYTHDARLTRTANAVLPAIPSNERPSLRTALEHDARLPDEPLAAHAPAKRRPTSAQPSALHPPQMPSQGPRPPLSVFLSRAASPHAGEPEPGYYMRRPKKPSADSRHCRALQHSCYRLDEQRPNPRLGHYANSR